MRSKSGTKLVPGDLVKIAESSDGSASKQVEVDKVSAATDCIYGVVTFGIMGDITPIVTFGHVVENVNSSTFSSAGVGKCLDTKHGSGYVVQKITALKADGSEEKSSAYEIKI